MSLIEHTKTIIDAVVESPTATASVSAPPLVVSATSLFGVTWQEWMYISAFVYTGLLIAGILWKWVSTWRRWWRERKSVIVVPEHAKSDDTARS